MNDDEAREKRLRCLPELASATEKLEREALTWSQVRSRSAELEKSVSLEVPHQIQSRLDLMLEVEKADSKRYEVVKMSSFGTLSV